jgi:spore coat protein U-like protein
VATVCAVSGAHAANTSSTLQVSVTVVTSCIVSTTSIVFGNTSGTLKDFAGGLSVTCTNGTPYAIALDAGSSSCATVASHKLTNVAQASQTFNYTFYQDATHRTVWGNTTGTDTVDSTGTGSAQSFSVYGRIFADQYLEACAYVGTVTVSY